MSRIGFVLERAAVDALPDGVFSLEGVDWPRTRSGPEPLPVVSAAAAEEAPEAVRALTTAAAVRDMQVERLVADVNDVVRTVASRSNRGGIFITWEALGMPDAMLGYYICERLQREGYRAAVTYQEYDANASDTEYRWVRRHGIAVAWVPASY